MSNQEDKGKKRKEFEEIALSYIDSLYRIALRMTKNEEEAMDLTQETYLKAYRFFNKFERGTNFKAWLFTILRNSYINRYRNRSKEPLSIKFDETEPYYHQLIKEEGASSEENFFENLSDEHIKQALEDLPEGWRLVIILADIEDFSYKEIAQITKSPIGTVMSRLYRGRNLLRKKLWEYVKKAKLIKE